MYSMLNASTYHVSTHVANLFYGSQKREHNESVSNYRVCFFGIGIIHLRKKNIRRRYYKAIKI